ncbi:MAG: MATE family efflux transporter [Ruminococcaceae bacterium]|nr:MATE family efflux transporter [Oscillospiraceae bacterium]
MQHNSQIKDFTKGSITKNLIIFALPLFFANLLQVVYNMADMAVVGHVLGKTGISAVSVGGDVTHLLTFIAMGLSNAGQVLIARYIGAKEKHKIGKFVGTMSGFLVISAFVLTALGLIFQTELLTLMNTPEEAFKGAVSYSTVSMAGLIFIYGYNTVSAILRGMGDSKHPFIFIAIAAVLNVFLDLLFVIKFNMGEMGAALATIISQTVSFISCVVFLIKRRKEFELTMKLKDFIFWDKEMLSALLKLGIPMAIKTASIQISKLFVNSYINSYGVAVSAFSGIANKIASVANLISMAMNTAGSTVVGQNLAAGEFKRVKKVLKSLAEITLTVSTFFSVLIILFPEEIFSLFISTNETDVLSIAKNYIPIAILLFYGAAARAIMNALLNGSGNYKINFATAIFDGIIMRIGLALLFGLALNMQYYGFWLGDALAGFTPFFIGVVFYVSGRWKK